MVKMNPADDEPLSNSDPPISASNSAPQKHASSVAVPVNALEIRSAPKPDAIETPAAPKALLTKKQCFCFEELILYPGVTVEMPVFFSIDPDIEDDQIVFDVHDIILDYQFHKFKKY
jgi:hypothetical protein